MTDSEITVPSSQSDEDVDSLADIITKVSFEEDDKSPVSTNDADTDETKAPARPAVVYTRSQMLFLQKSPLVHVPEGMPELKDWFGDWSSQFTPAKDTESSTTSTTNRDRRFRRDADEGDAPTTRPAFRSTLTQPSQMGNFKHQSLRTGDRDRDRDTDKERDKEGLRNLSDKFDRDRLAHPSSSTLMRNRERDAAPHLTASSSARSTTQTQASTAATRRTDAREPTRRRVGETSDDWRRGAEPVRGGKEDRTDVSRRDRDDRERPRSRVRDSSRTRRDPSTRREEKDKDRDREKDRDRRPEKRDRDADKDGEDDPRRWRDDGKRDDRTALRRERERDRDRDRGRESDWDSYDRTYDRFRGDRWTPADEKEGRPKRSSGRERRGDEPTHREKEREKEKEPAWMETYIPSSSSGGILGGKTTDGELDGIQAWKKGMKEKEQKEKGIEVDSGPAERSSEQDKSAGATPSLPSGNQLDEIQLFKLLMKKEEEKRKTDGGKADPTKNSSPENGVIVGPIASNPSSGHQTGFSTPQIISGSSVAQAAGRDSVFSPPEHAFSSQQPSSTTSPRTDDSPATPSDGPRSLLSIIASGSSDSATSRVVNSRPSSEFLRTYASPSFPDAISSVGQSTDKSAFDRVMSDSPAPPQFNPPPGSRLLAFGSRGPAPTSHVQSSKSQSPSNQFLGSHPGGGMSHSLMPGLGSQSSTPGQFQRQEMLLQSLDNAFRQAPDAEMNFHQGQSHNDSLHIQQGYPPFNDPSRAFGLEPSRESVGFQQPLDHLRRTSVASSSERSQYGHQSDLMNATYSELGGRTTPSTQGSLNISHQPSPYELVNGSGGLNHAAAKGSRFAKFFDSKSREIQSPGMGKSPGLGGPPGLTAHRQEQGGMPGGNQDNRTMDDIFAMLNSSAQSQRQVNPVNHMPPGVGGPGQNLHMNLQALQQQQQQQQQLRQQQQQTFLNNRLDSIPDHRLDDRNFVPDGLVPGLRTAPPARSRDPTNGLYPEQLDEHLQINYQRIPPQQRTLDQMYNGPGSSAYPHQPGPIRNSGLPLQQPQYRGGPSPITNQTPLQVPGQQRLPPGLAHLGGRPPHDNSQFIGTPMGMTTGGLPGGPHGNPSQQTFNNIPGGGGLGFGGGPQMRVQQHPGPHQLQNHLAAQNALAGLGHPTNLDLRAGPNQAQLLGLGANPPGLRGAGAGGVSGGFGGPQQGPGGQLQAQHLLRQQQQQPQQQQHIPHQMMQHNLLPPHLQQQGLSGANSPPAPDLMALLMGAGRRE